MQKPERIAIIGAGNVATFIASALYRAGYIIDQVFSRRKENAIKLAGNVGSAWTTDISLIDPEADIWIFALTDDAILKTVGDLGRKKGLLVHTAGSLPMDIFSGHSDNFGVLYPLQSITAKGVVRNKDFPVCIEGNNDSSLAGIRALASEITGNVHEISTDERVWLHLAAVFACNFTNHMYVLAHETLKKVGLSFDLLHPLINETAGRCLEPGPLQSQTGPAVRNDQIIINKHLDLLSFSPEWREIYAELTRSITSMSVSDPGNIYGNNLKEMGNFKEDLNKVKAFAFDVDGVFSESSLLLNPDGELLRSMNIKDGFAIQLAVKKGYPIAIITGGNSDSVRKRFNMLGIKDVYLKSSRKLDDFKDFCSKYNLDPSDILYMGDDLPDHPVMELAGLPTCPRDAVPEIKKISKYVSDRPGGTGCVRDVVEQVLRAQGKWTDSDVTFVRL